jgi:hypothetical protein
VDKNLQATGKMKKAPESLSRRFCVAPMMDSESGRRNALRLNWLAGLSYARGVLGVVLPRSVCEAAACRSISPTASDHALDIWRLINVRTPVPKA